MPLLLVAMMLLLWFVAEAIGEEELMMCNGCDKTLELKYEDGLFTEINFRYEWPD